MEEPSEIEHWKRISILGSGAFGVVSLWQHTLTDEYIAIKKCKFRTNTHLSDRQRNRWENEVKIMQNLNCNNIVAFKPLPKHLEVILMKYNPTKLPLLSMEYCKKGNLRRTLSQVKNLSGLQEEEVRVVLTDITNAVAHLHKYNITHRDIKPENIVLQECNNRPGQIIYKLIDLGYAKELGDSIVSFVGTLHYIAPEIMKTENYNHCVDYWSLGIVAFEVICGVLPFLPQFTPIERFSFIEKKSPEHICIYQLHSGSVVYSSELLKENHISSCLKQNIEIWLRHVLQFDPNQRGMNFPSDINVFDFLLKILDKKIIQVFSVYTLEFYSYEINEGILINTLKDWIARDTKIQKSDQILLSNLQIFDINDEKYVMDILPKDNNLFVFKKGVFINKDTFKLPKYITILFENCTMKYKWRDLRQIYIKTLFFLSQEEKLISSIKTAFRLCRCYINDLNIKLNNNMQQIHKTLSNQLIRIDCYYNLHSDKSKRNNFGDTYKQYLLKFQYLLVDLEKSIHNGNDLNKKVAILLKRQAVLDKFLHNVIPVINNCNVGNEIAKASELMLKSNSVEELTPRDMVKIISSIIKEKDKLLNNKNFRNYTKAILVAVKDVETLQVWMNSFYKQIKELSQAIDDNQREQYHCLLSLAESKRKNGPLKDLSSNFVHWDADLVISENENLRCQIEEVIGELFVLKQSFSKD